MNLLISPEVALPALYGGCPARQQPIGVGVDISPEARRRVDELVATGLLARYHNGPWALRFEAEFAAYHGPGNLAVAVNSGTSALHLAISAAGIGPGDEVIVPALCFVAAATAVVQNGAIPIVADAEPDYLTLDPAHVDSLTTPRTKAVVAVHFWGYPADLTALRRLCDRKGLVLIEDCAQALGAPACGATVGTFGDYATYAFSVRKHIVCGEGGMVMCRDATRHNTLREMSNYGKGPGWDDYSSLGFSYRMAEFPAIVALDGLGRLDDEIAARRRAGTHYAELFSKTGMKVVTEPPWGRSAFFKCPVLLPVEMADLRQTIVNAIAAENVSCRIPHRPLFRIPWLEEYLRGKGAYRGPEGCPVAADAHSRLIEIETGPHLPFAEAEVTGTAVMKVWRHLTATTKA